MKTAERVYDALLRLYPQSYRDTFGAEMRQTFRDLYQDVQRSHGRVGVGFWLEIVGDDLRNVLRQHAACAAAGNGSPGVTVFRRALTAALSVPLYALMFAALVRVCLALPHPHVSGLGALAALSALFVLPAFLSLAASWALATGLVRAAAAVGTRRRMKAA
jgi:hypothetical protein